MKQCFLVKCRLPLNSIVDTEMPPQYPFSCFLLTEPQYLCRVMIAQVKINTTQTPWQAVGTCNTVLATEMQASGTGSAGTPLPHLLPDHSRDAWKHLEAFLGAKG